MIHRPRTRMDRKHRHTAVKMTTLVIFAAAVGIVILKIITM